MDRIERNRKARWHLSHDGCKKPAANSYEVALKRTRTPWAVMAMTCHLLARPEWPRSPASSLWWPRLAARTAPRPKRRVARAPQVASWSQPSHSLVGMSKQHSRRRPRGGRYTPPLSAVIASDGSGPKAFNQMARRQCSVCGSPVQWLSPQERLAPEVATVLAEAVEALGTPDMDVWRCGTCREMGFLERAVHTSWEDDEGEG